eukprot:5111638-Lingulodinium_polyedra.AAC.1
MADWLRQRLRVQEYPIMQSRNDVADMPNANKMNVAKDANGTALPSATDLGGALKGRRNVLNFGRMQ